MKETYQVEKLMVMGCFSERYGSDLVDEMPEVDKFFGTNDHSVVLSYLTGKEYKKDDPDYYRSILTPRHYAYLKIAEGCDNVCSFCSIPSMRGLQVSNTMENNLLEAQRLADDGIKELLVIAQDTTSYGWDLSPKSSLHELLDVLDNVNNLEDSYESYKRSSNRTIRELKRNISILQDDIKILNETVFPPAEEDDKNKK